MWRKLCLWKSLKTTELTPLIIVWGQFCWEFPLQVYSVKILGRNKTSKYYVTFDGGESYQLKSKIDRGSIYYPFLFAYTSWQIKDILIMTTFFGCKIFVHKSCHMIHLLFKIDLYIYKQYKLLICKFSWVEGVYAVSIETLPPYGVYPIWVNLFQTPSLIFKGRNL